MVYLELFFSFVKIGFTSFGGMSMVPLILEEMQSHRWMSSEDLTNLVAIAEMTPGPLGINCATFAGTQTAGIPGGIAAVTGVLTPAFTLTLLAAVFFNRFRKSAVMENIMSFVKPVCIGMIFDVIVTLSIENYFSSTVPEWRGILVGGVMFYMIMRYRWSVPKVIGSAAVSGLVLYGILPYLNKY